MPTRICHHPSIRLQPVKSERGIDRYQRITHERQIGCYSQILKERAGMHEYRHQRDPLDRLRDILVERLSGRHFV